MLFDAPCSTKIIRNKYERCGFKAQSPGKHFSNLIMKEYGPPLLHWWLGDKAMRSLVQKVLAGQVFFKKPLIFASRYHKRKLQFMVILESFTKQVKHYYEGNSSCTL